MKTATPFFSEFFNTDCLVVEGVPHFSITGATKTLYGNTGGKSLKLLTDSLLRSGPQSPVPATDLSELDGIGPVLIDNGHMKQEGQAMTQDIFLALIELYRGKDSKAGRYASSLGSRLNKVAADMILRKEAGLLAVDGRHMKRQAVAAEYNSGRNMEAWYREVGLPPTSGRELLAEARKLELIADTSSSTTALSQALPTARAAREYAKAEPEVKEIVKATRNADNTQPLNKWLDGASKPSHANASGGFPQAFDGACFECLIPREGRGEGTAKLFSPAVAWHWILNELTNRSAAVQQRALKLVQVVGAIRYSQSSP